MSKRLQKHFVLGITGKIGAGKSTIARTLEKKGWFYLDCDQITHELYEPNGRGAEKIQTFFGDEFLKKDESVNRSKLMRTLLKNTKKWDILNRLIHPLVADEIERRLRKIDSPKIVVEIQVFNEKLFKDLFDELWIIEAPQKIRHSRKTNLSSAEIEAVEAQQSKSLELTDAHVISNSSTIDDLLKSLP
ncbi:dephospho-CoA kinase [Candidatus Peregrinibacteria bacterium]|jgi:dephospho-CoA kinase|nr:dephospho-CoA kinase [Candidatus Peregrinibacteria bacterium]MBT7484160.1 dephospho-CoA kinase [Candidatus Peregrinibacteria bacterium]MBT7703520.1 dephospho-CoA kinase [Candidatus Peregrinibacteria bacterium]